jgi:hypothetical protein
MTQDVRVKITRKGSAEELAVVTVPRRRGQEWARHAKSEAVISWRRESGDHRTSIAVEVLS